MKKIVILIVFLLIPACLVAQWDSRETLRNQYLYTSRANISDTADALRGVMGDTALIYTQVEGLSNDSLILFLPMDYDTTSTGIIKDYSGKGHNGDVTFVTQGITHVTKPDSFYAGKGAFRFNYVTNSDSGYISIGDDDDFSFGNGNDDTPFSVSAWVYVYDMTKLRLFIKDDYPTASNREYIVGTSGADKIYFYLSDQSASANIAGNSPSTITSYENQWIHLVYTYDGSSTVGGMAVYINGTSIGTLDSTGTNTYIAMENLTSDVNIGAQSTTNQYSKIYMDEFRIDRRELSASEVWAIYKHSAHYNLQDTKLDTRGSVIATNDSSVIIKDYLIVGDSALSVFDDINEEGSIGVSGDLEVKRTLAFQWSIADTSGDIAESYRTLAQPQEVDTTIQFRLLFSLKKHFINKNSILITCRGEAVPFKVLRGMKAHIPRIEIPRLTRDSTFIINDTLHTVNVPRYTENDSLRIQFNYYNYISGMVMQIDSLTGTMRLSYVAGRKSWIVSTNPAMVLNESRDGVTVAHAGSVPVIVNAGTPVRAGDALVAGVNGTAVKRSAAWQEVIGWALESKESGIGKIRMIVE